MSLSWLILLSIPVLLLVAIALIVLRLISADRKMPLRPRVEHLHRAWSDLERIERRIAVLEAVIIERCGDTQPREFAENVSVYRKGE